VRPTLKIYFIAFISLFLTLSLLAQDNNSSISSDNKKVWGTDYSASSYENNSLDIMNTNDDPGSGTGNGTDNVLDAPIDGGLSFLIAAGVLYGARRIRRTKSHKLKK
jgi:hypothetical protein